jgi:hypothetical protein
MMDEDERNKVHALPARSTRQRAWDDIRKLATFSAQRDEIVDLLDRLKDSAEDHFHRDPDEVSLEDVAVLARVKDGLEAIARLVLRSGPPRRPNGRSLTVSS